MAIVRLTVDDVRITVLELAKTFSEEPMPAFEECDIGLLESALNAPFAEFGGKEPYKSIDAKAAALMYSLTKNHAFTNGNKRMAVTSTMVFLVLNSMWARIDPYKLYEIAKLIAESDSSERSDVIKILITLFKHTIEPLETLE